MVRTVALTLVLPLLGALWSASAGAAPHANYRDLCPAAADGSRRCDVKIRTDEGGRFKFDSQPNGGYAPADLQSAYGLSSSAGSGRIVALFAGGSDYTSAESDLGVYRSQYGLPDCTSANGCFIKIDEHGGTNYPSAGSDEGEQALDMEMASAACPGCKIMLVEGGDMDVALATAISMGASAFSFSVLYGFGGATGSECQSLGFDNLSGLLVTGALGDTAYPGARDYIPATCQGALAVGGTTLNKDSSARGWSETTWSGTGSGCSPYVAKPPWQTDTGCSMRMEADVAAVADPGTGVSFYYTQGGGGWGVVGGTSAASPLVAGALTALGVANKQFTPAWVWQHTNLWFDITTGNNGTCSSDPSYFCTAGAAYDGPTGWGTPNGALLATAPPPSLGGSDGGTCATPGGSYLASCTSCSAAAQGGGCELTCQSCTKIDGSQNPNPTLALPCTGSIDNDNGVLVCTGGTTPMLDAGSEAGGGDGGSDASLGSDATIGSGDAGTPGDAGLYVPPAPVDDSGAIDNGGAPTTVTASASGSASCGCATAGSGGFSASGAAGVALVFAWAGRRRRRSGA
ncbi:MAG TPA: S8 family serine peptidase [Polyangiaceae bacterium]|jgi:MYXO-CTERM domain-containing protein